MMNCSAENVRYFRISFVLALVSNQFVYQGSRLLIWDRVHYSLALPIDSAIPFLPWTIVIYFGCLLFWFFLYRLVAQLPREQADRFFCSNLLGKGICFLVFILFPTAITRPEVTGSSIWDTLIRFLYRVDSPDNLFPSLHCMVSWLCWAGVRGNRQVPLFWRFSTFTMAVLVCLSTLTTRQHVILDVFAGILLSEFCYRLANLPVLRRLYTNLIDCLTYHIEKVLS